MELLGHWFWFLFDQRNQDLISSHLIVIVWEDLIRTYAYAAVIHGVVIL